MLKSELCVTLIRGLTSCLFAIEVVMFKIDSLKKNLSKADLMLILMVFTFKIRGILNSLTVSFSSFVFFFHNNILFYFFVNCINL